MNTAPSSLLPAIVPAAGKSRRMGRPKLLIPFGGVPLIARVVRALLDGGAGLVIVVSPPDDVPEGPAIADRAREAGARVVTPSARPAEMRESVELALAELKRNGPPRALMLTPADSPALTSEIVRRVLDRWTESPESMVIPVAGGKRTHPLILPWDLARRIPAIPAHLGINSLATAHPERIVEIEIPAPELAEDMNTPEDLSRWRGGQDATVTVRLFAVARERAGASQVEVSLMLPATVADLRAALALQHPALAPLAPRVMIAVDAEYASDTSIIEAGTSIALIPPVSGGAEESR